MSKKLLLTLGLCILANSVSAEDWPQWQSSASTAVSTESGLLNEWPANGPAVAWRIENLGGGDNAPAVVGGRIFGMSKRAGQEVVWALAEKEGTELRKKAIGEAVVQRMPQSK